MQQEFALTTCYSKRMINFVPSPLDEKYFTGQISIDGVGIEGQHKLFNSSVVLLGLSAIGIYAVRGLLAAGVGKIHIIDNSVVKETDIGAHPLFSTNDIGKLKCIVLKEKSTASWSSHRIELHSIKLTKQNAHIVLPKNFDFAISASNDPQEVRTFSDLADERSFYIVGGLALDWTCRVGIYTGNNDTLYKEKINTFFDDPNNIRHDACMSGTALAAGGMITNIALSVLLGNVPAQSIRFELCMKDITTAPIFGKC